MIEAQNAFTLSELSPAESSSRRSSRVCARYNGRFVSRSAELSSSGSCSTSGRSSESGISPKLWTASTENERYFNVYDCHYLNDYVSSHLIKFKTY